MRFRFFLLLMVNLGLLGYQWLNIHFSNLNNYLQQQLAPEKIRLLSYEEYENYLNGGESDPRRIPDKNSTVNTQRCWQWNLLTEAEKNQITKSLEGVVPFEVLSGNDLTTWWVYLAPLPNKTAIDKKVQQLKLLGIKDWFIINEAGSYKNAISLGVFRSEAAAQHLSADLGKKGLSMVQVTPRKQNSKPFTLKFPDLLSAQEKKLQEIQRTSGGGELLAGPCPPIANREVD